MADVAHLSDTAKVAEAMKRSLAYVGPEAKAQLEGLFTPTNLSIMAGTLVVWAASHFFGVGEFVDLALLAVGVVAIGRGVFDGAEELYKFATKAVAARDDRDLDSAARHFARGVEILGVTTVMAILTKGQAKSIAARGWRPRYRPEVRPRLGPRPAVPRVRRVAHITSSRPNKIVFGSTDAWGNIKLLRVHPDYLAQYPHVVQHAFYHEWVHSALAPKLGPFRNLRASFRQSAYKNSAILRYLEEALAEAFANFKVHGMRTAIREINFPVKEHYMTVAQLKAEGYALGTIVVGGITWHVTLRHGRPPDTDD